SRHARSIRDASYCFHDVFRSQSQLMAQGYDREQVRKLPSHGAGGGIEEHARDTGDESTLRRGDAARNAPSRLIAQTEHYVKMGFEGNEKPRLYRVTTAGAEGEILTRGGEPDVIEEDRIPFAAMTPVIVTHRFFGRSIADLVKDVQEIKTVLLRGM